MTHIIAHSTLIGNAFNAIKEVFFINVVIMCVAFLQICLKIAVL